MSNANEIVNGQPIRCYDNGGKTADRYSVLFMGEPERGGLYAALGMSRDPFSPQGVGQHTTAMPGRHLGKRVRLADLPPDCQKLVRSDLGAYSLRATK
jgi:hypothetical protein